MKQTEHGRTACKEYEARLEDYLDSSTGSEQGLSRDPAEVEKLAAHLERCAGCREAFEAARLGRELLRAGLERTREPSGAFAARVVAGIRTEEARRGQFWRPLELLASRLALTAAVTLLLLAVYLFEFTPPRHRDQIASQSEISEGFSEPAAQPANKDEVLLTLAGNHNGR